MGIVERRAIVGGERAELGSDVVGEIRGIGMIPLDAIFLDPGDPLPVGGGEVRLRRLRRRRARDQRPGAGLVHRDIVPAPRLGEAPRWPGRLPGSGEIDGIEMLLNRRLDARHEEHRACFLVDAGDPVDSPGAAG